MSFLVTSCSDWGTSLEHHWYKVSQTLTGFKSSWADELQSPSFVVSQMILLHSPVYFNSFPVRARKGTESFASDLASHFLAFDYFRRLRYHQCILMYIPSMALLFIRAASVVMGFSPNLPCVFCPYLNKLHVCSVRISFSPRASPPDFWNLYFRSVLP